MVVAAAAPAETMACQLRRWWWWRRRRRAAEHNRRCRALVHHQPWTVQLAHHSILIWMLTRRHSMAKHFYRRMQNSRPFRRLPYHRMASLMLLIKVNELNVVPNKPSFARWKSIFVPDYFLLLLFVCAGGGAMAITKIAHDTRQPNPISPKPISLNVNIFSFSCMCV